jgi:hypothetical protein
MNGTVSGEAGGVSEFGGAGHRILHAGHGNRYRGACYPSISARANSVTIVAIVEILIFHRPPRSLITSLLPESVSPDA